MWTFLEVFISGKYMFSAWQPSSLLFSPKLCVLNCALLAIHHCLFWVQKIRNQSFQRFLKSQMWISSHTISLNKGLLNTSSHLR